MKPGPSETVLELLLSEEPAVGAAGRGGGVAVGRLTGFDASGQPLVQVPGEGSAESRTARTTVALGPAQVGAEVVLAFEEASRRPIVMGVLVDPQAATAAENGRPSGVEADVDGEALVLTAKREIVLRCGRASITLTRAGKILLRGAYLLSRSSGVNRIKGGSVQIN